MPREFSRTKRVGDQMQRELALLIQTGIKDPRVGMVTVTAVEVTKEYERATVYITTLGDEKVSEETLAVLNQAAGFLRKQLGNRLSLRRIPQLNFVSDNSISNGRHLSDLINRAVESDQHTDQSLDEDSMKNADLSSDLNKDA